MCNFGLLNWPQPIRLSLFRSPTTALRQNNPITFRPQIMAGSEAVGTRVHASLLIRFEPEVISNVRVMDVHCGLEAEIGGGREERLQCGRSRHHIGPNASVDFSKGA